MDRSAHELHSHGLLQDLGRAILNGRDFRITDGDGAPKVAIINEKFARKYFADGNAIAGTSAMGGDPGTKTDIESSHRARFEI